MKRVWLVLDVSNLCWRAFHTTGRLSFGQSGTGVVYGFFKSVSRLMELHCTTNVAFCFDHGESIRKDALASYKKKRHDKEQELTDEQKEARVDMKRQMNQLRTDYLPRLGFKNIFYQAGYEGDDVIASVVHNLSKKDEAVVVSSDSDFYQLLVPGKVFVWKPVEEEMVTAESFQEKWRFPPPDWAHLKALAGCPTDGVPGIKGIGEAFAANWLRGECEKGSRVDRLIRANSDLYKKFLGLVELPMEGTWKFKTQQDEIKPKAWKYITKKLGMKSIADRVPGMVTGFGIKPTKLRTE